MQKRVALINDLSGHGKCSITSQLPIVAAFGDVASCCITSYLSNHTGYKNKYKIDLNNHLPKVLDMWKENGFKFDGILTGYIGNKESILDVREYIADLKLENENMLVMVDPVCADNGQYYCEMTSEHIENYKKLMEIADVITPNITEACFLTGIDYEELRIKCGLLNYDGSEKEKLEHISKKVIEALNDLLKKIIVKRNQISLITGIELYNGVVTVLDVYDGDKGIRQTTCNFVNKLESRSGTGDLFDVLFFEAVLFGYKFVDCLNIASGFVNNALRFTIDKKYPKEDGVVYEPILVDNINVIRNSTKKEKIK